MAKDLNRSIKIYIDHSDAMKKSTDFGQKIDAVKQKLEDLSNQGKKDTPEYKAQEDILRKLEVSYDRYKTKLAETERILKNLSGATRGELESLRKEIKASLKNVARGTDEYKAKVQALIAVEKQLSIVKQEQNGTLGRNATLWSRAADGFNKYFGLITSFIAGITGLSFALRKLSEDVAKMDDVYSDVMKTTGMTRDQVLDLNETFKKMDTRTAREELNNLARDAGKLGLEGKKDILDFVEAGNQINVALGEDLGEGAIKNIGKMTDVYARSTRELERMDLKGKMLAIGSAINELGASSTASEAYMVNFTQRLGGVASQAGISIQNILGYASALDQSGQAVEMSATALQNFIMKLMGDPAKFAKLAGLEVKAFTELLQTDTNAAIKQVLTALSNKGGFQALIPIFKDMGLDGARAVGVLSALATNIDKINTAQQISNKAFTEGTSITDEYAIKNNNLNALLEKARKEFNDSALELGERLNPVLLTSTKLTTNFIKLLPSVLNFFDKYGKYLLYISVVGGAYLAGVKLQVLWNTRLAGVLTLTNIQLKLKAVRLIAVEAATHLYWIAVSILNLRLKDALRSFVAFCAVLKVNPIGLATGLVMALVGAIYLLSSRTKEAITQTQRLAEVNNEAAKSIAGERAEINLLLSVARNEKISKEERLKAIKRLNEISPEYLSNLNLENINTQAVTDSVKKYTEELIKNARAKSIQGRIQDQSDKILSLDEQIQEKRREQEKLRQELAEIERGDKVVSPSARAGMVNRIANSEIMISRLEKEKLAVQETIQTYTDFYQDLHQSSPLKKQETEFQKLNNLLSQQADIYTRLKENKDNASYNAHHKRQDELQLQMLTHQIEAQRKLAQEESNRLKDDTTTTAPIVPIGGDSEKGANKLAAQQRKELDTKLKVLENGYKSELLLLNETKKKEQQTDEQYRLITLEHDKKYYNERIQALEKFKEKITDANLLAEIDKRIVDTRKQLSDANAQVDIARLAALESEKNQSLQIIDGWFNEEKKKLAEQNLSQVEYAAKMQLLELTSAEIRLAIVQRHNNDVVESEIENGKLKADAVRKSGEEAIKVETDVIARRKDLNKKYHDSEKSIREKYDLVTFRERKEKEIQALDELHKAGLISEETYQRALQEINKKYDKEKQQAKKQWGLESIAEEYTQELELLNEHHAQGLLSEAEYQQALLTLKVKYAKKYADQFTNTVGGMFTALQDAETAKLDAEYDVRIKAAEGNAKEVERLEEEKAQKKLDIEKKYADVQFAVKASEIIANTAVAIMTGYAQLGPIAGKIAAVMLGITGAAQLAAANAERQKIKNMTLGGSASGSGGYQRVVSQQATGKYDVIGADDGKLYKNVPYAGTVGTGIVSSPTLIAEDGGELVVSSPDLRALQKHINYPLIVQAINEVRAGSVPQRASGKYDAIDSSSNNVSMLTGIAELRITLDQLTKTVSVLSSAKLQASVNIHELAQKQAVVDDFENFGKKV